MGLADGVRHLFRTATGPPTIDGVAELQVGDPRFDDWPVVDDYPELEVARAWCQQLNEGGIEAVLTSDWPLDKWGRGDIALRVPPGMWSEAQEAMDTPED